MTQRNLISLAVLGVLLLATNAHACRIPVFRYALERWPPGTFELVILHSGEFTPAQSDLVQLARERATDDNHPVNLRVTTIALGDDPISPENQVLLRATGIAPAEVQSPQAALLFPRTRGETTIAWRGEFTSSNLDRLLDSPARQQTIDHLLGGDSAVWVLIEGPDATANEAAAATLETELARNSELIKLPSQEILEAEEEFREDTAIELRVGFSLLRLKRDDPQEAAFIEMLLNCESDLSTFQEPIAIPIFGRGRTYYALVGKGIQPDLIEENCRFICGDCSCQVKEENPGSDLLFAANWEEGLRGSAFPEQVLPELSGIGSLEVIDLTDYERQAALADSDTKPSDDAVAVVDLSGDPDLAATDMAAAPGITNLESERKITAPVWNALWPVIGLAFVLAAAGFLLLRS